MSENKILRENMRYQTEIESYKMRLDSKEKEIEKLYQKILDQDSNYGITARKLEEDFREREAQLMSKAWLHKRFSIKSNLNDRHPKWLSIGPKMTDNN